MGKRTTKSKDFVKVLWSIRHGHDVPTNYRGKIRVGRRQTTLMHALCGLDPACSQKDWREPTLRSLEAAGADIDAKDSDGQTPLEDAVGSLVHGIDDGMELAIQTLLELGAKVPDDLFFLPWEKELSAKKFQPTSAELARLGDAIKMLYNAHSAATRQRFLDTQDKLGYTALMWSVGCRAIARAPPSYDRAVRRLKTPIWMRCPACSWTWAPTSRSSARITARPFHGCCHPRASLAASIFWTFELRGAPRRAPLRHGDGPFPGRVDEPHDRAPDGQGRRLQGLRAMG